MFNPRYGIQLPKNVKMEESVNVYTIHKYKLQITFGNQEMELPFGARYLSCQMQNDELCIWFQIKKNEVRTQMRKFCIIPTGGDFYSIPITAYLSTVQDGSFVWHIYEVFENKK